MTEKSPTALYGYYALLISAIVYVTYSLIVYVAYSFLTAVPPEPKDTKQPVANSCRYSYQPIRFIVKDSKLQPVDRMLALKTRCEFCHQMEGK